MGVAGTRPERSAPATTTDGGPARVGDARSAHVPPVATYVVADCVAIGVSLVIAHLMRFGVSAALLPGPNVPYVLVGLLAAPVWLGVLALAGCYDRRILGVGSDEYRRVLNGGVHFLAVVAISHFLGHLVIARGYVGVLIPVAVVLTLLSRTLRLWLRPAPARPLRPPAAARRHALGGRRGRPAPRAVGVDGVPRRRPLPRRRGAARRPPHAGHRLPFRAGRGHGGRPGRGRRPQPGRRGGRDHRVRAGRAAGGRLQPRRPRRRGARRPPSRIAGLGRSPRGRRRVAPASSTFSGPQRVARGVRPPRRPSPSSCSTRCSRRRPGGQARHPRPGLLPAGPGRARRRAAVRDRQVPHDGDGGRPAARRA